MEGLSVLIVPTYLPTVPSVSKGNRYKPYRQCLPTCERTRARHLTRRWPEAGGDFSCRAALLAFSILSSGVVARRGFSHRAGGVKRTQLQVETLPLLCYPGETIRFFGSLGFATYKNRDCGVNTLGAWGISVKRLGKSRERGRCPCTGPSVLWGVKQ